MSTPSEALAKRIVARLVTEGLVTSHEGEKLCPSIAGGTVRAEDWRLALENSQPSGTAG